MVGVQDHGHVEGALHDIVGPVPGQRVEKIGGEPQPGIAGDDRLTVAQAVERGDDRGRLRHELDRLFIIRFRRHIARLRIVQAEHRYRRAQDIHWCGLRHGREEIDHCTGNSAMRAQVAFQLLELRPLRQAAVP